MSLKLHMCPMNVHKKCRCQSGILIEISENAQMNALLHSLTHSLTLMRLCGHLLRVFQVENCVILGAIKSGRAGQGGAGSKAKAKSERIA